MSIQTRPLSNDEAFDRWSTDLCKQAINHRHSVWSIGDLLLEGERKFEDGRYMAALEATRLTIETLMNYKSLAKCFPAGKRRLNLGVSSHEAVRSLDDVARDALLDLVEKHEISRDNLRDRVKAYKGGDVGALAYKWKQPNKVTEVEDHAARENDDDDKPVFDASDAGAGLDAERREVLEGLRADDRRSANAELDAINRAIQKFEQSRHLLNLDAVSRDSLQASIAVLREVATAKARHDQKHLIGSASPTPASNSAALMEGAGEVAHGQ